MSKIELGINKYKENENAWRFSKLLTNLYLRAQRIIDDEKIEVSIPLTPLTTKQNIVLKLCVHGNGKEPGSILSDNCC